MSSTKISPFSSFSTTSCVQNKFKMNENNKKCLSETRKSLQPLLCLLECSPINLSNYKIGQSKCQYLLSTTIKIFILQIFFLAGLYNCWLMYNAQTQLSTDAYADRMVWFMTLLMWLGGELQLICIFISIRWFRSKALDKLLDALTQVCVFIICEKHLHFTDSWH
jgi:hypothetical protein